MYEYKVIERKTYVPTVIKNVYDDLQHAKIIALRSSRTYNYVYINVIDMRIGVHINTCFKIVKKNYGPNLSYLY